MRNPETHYRPDPSFARKYASEAAINSDIEVSTFAGTDYLTPVDAPEPQKRFLTFEPVSEKQKHAAEMIELGVKRLLEDPDSYYRFAGKFHQYSIHNQILIMAQRPDATRVASMKTWNSMGRFVNKGETGMAIFYPMFGKEQEIVDQDTGEIRTHKPLVGFGVGKTFDIAQTNGKPLPDEPTIVERLGVTEGAKDIDRRATAYGLGQGIRFTKVPTGSARGFYAPFTKTIGLSDELPFGDILTTKTLLHELAHAEDQNILKGDRRDSESVAESAAYITMAHFGYDTSAYSHHYLANWAQDMNRLRHNLSDAQKIATKLITRIEGENPERVGDWS